MHGAQTLSRGAGHRLEAYVTLRLGPNVAQASRLYWICTEQLRLRRSDSGPDAWRPDFESWSRTQAGSLCHTAFPIRRATPQGLSLEFGHFEETPPDALFHPGIVLVTSIEWIAEADWVKLEGCEFSTPPVRALRRFAFCPTVGIIWRSATPGVATVGGAIWRSPVGARMAPATRGEPLFICAIRRRENSGPQPISPRCTQLNSTKLLLRDRASSSAGAKATLRSAR